MLKFNKLIDKTEQGKVDWKIISDSKCVFKIGNGEFHLSIIPCGKDRVEFLTIYVNNGIIVDTFNGNDVKKLADLVYGKYISPFILNREIMLDEVIEKLDKLM